MKSLDVSSNQLIRIPEGLNSIPIENLNVSHNFISEIPHYLIVTNQLVNLSIGYCRLRSVPPEIGLLNQLRCLIMCSNSIEFLPKEIGNLINLKSLDLNDNLLSHLPDSIGDLKDLIWMNLSHNLLEELPSSFLELKNLEQIGLANNALTQLFDIGLFPNLVNLSAFANRIHSLNFDKTPKRLERLEMSSNLLEFVTERLFYCPRLKYVNLRHNHLQKIESCHYTTEHLIESSDLVFIDVSDNQFEYLTYILLKISSKCLVFECHGNPFGTESCLKKRELDFPSLQMISFAKYLKTYPSSQELELVIPFYLKPRVNAYSICDHCGLIYPKASSCFYILHFNSFQVPFISKFCSQPCYYVFHLMK